MSHTQSHHKSCVTPTVSSQILCHTHSLITNPVSHTHTVSSQIPCHTHSLITNPVSHPQSHHESCVTPTVSSQILCHNHSLITNPVSQPQSHHKYCVTPSLTTNTVSHPQSHHKSRVTPTVSSQLLCHTHSFITNTLTKAEQNCKHVCFMEMDTVIRSIIFKGTTKWTSKFMMYFIHSILTNMFRVILVYRPAMLRQSTVCRHLICGRATRTYP